jgi:hypothetical protein
MRWPAAGALACAVAMVACLAAPAASQARPHAVIAFLPATPAPDQPLLYELARRGMAIGFTSPTVGGYKKRQVALDMGQGTRIPTRLYSKTIGPLRLRRTRDGWVLSGWRIARKRATKAPGDVVPGLLASALERAGRRVAYVGAHGLYGLGPIVAADERGRVENVLLGSPPRVAGLVVRAMHRFDLVVADLPPGGAGLRALDRILQARQRDDLVYVVRAPTGKKLHLLASGLAAPGVRGQLRSRTTRRDGLIAATDIAPSVLEHLGVKPPDAMQGEPVQGSGRTDPGAVRALGDRLAVLTARRGDVLRWVGGSWLALLVVLGFASGWPGLRAAVRIGFLGGLWVPGVALLTAALAPERLAEAMIISLGSLALGLLTDLLVRWPAGPAVPAFVVLCAHTVDLAGGSPLIARSLTGPNPAGGARFFGIGNELETMLSFATLVGTGAALAWFARRRAPAPDPDAPGYHPEDLAPRRDRGRAAPFAFAVTAAIAAAIMGAGRLGADVGAVITLGAGGAAAVLASLRGGPSRRAVALAIAAPVVAVAVLIAIDLVTGGGAHLTKSVLHAGDSRDLTDVVRRRFQGSYSSLKHPGQAIVFAVALVIVVSLAVWRERVLAPLGAVRGGVYVRAGLIGAFLAVVVGTISNDSGPLILELGAVLLALGAGYAASPPRSIDA